MKIWLKRILYFFIGKLERDIPYNGLTKDQFLIIAMDTLKNMNWYISEITENHIAGDYSEAFNKIYYSLNIKLTKEFAIFKLKTYNDILGKYVVIKEFTKIFKEIEKMYSPKELEYEFKRLKWVKIKTEQRKNFRIKKIFRNLQNLFGFNRKKNK